MERKPYYVIRYFSSNLKLHEGILREKYPHDGTAIQLYLTDEEIQKYNHETAKEILRHYSEIILKRCLTMPPELILYAISEVLYGNAKKTLLCNKSV